MSAPDFGGDENA